MDQDKASTIQRLVEEYDQKLPRLLMREFHNRPQHVRDELKQEILIAIYDSLSRMDIDKIGYMRAWIMRIIQNKKTDYFRRINRQQNKLTVPLGDTDPPDAPEEENVDPFEKMNEESRSEENVKALKEAVAALRQRHRAVIVLKYKNGWCVPRIAGHLGLSEKKVYNLQDYALKKMKKFLKKKKFFSEFCLFALLIYYNNFVFESARSGEKGERAS